MTKSSIKGFLTQEEKLVFRTRPCNSCDYLKHDEYATFGFCSKYSMWNPTGSYGCSHKNKS